MSKASETEFTNERRLIHVNGSFDEKKVEQVVTKLLHFEHQDPSSDIILFIDSYGGSADGFIALHDTIKMLRCDVATVCVGKAMSAGQMLLISGKKGKRFITPNSRVLMHEVGDFCCGKLKDLDDRLTETRRLQAMAESMILKYTNITKKQLKEFMSADTFFTAKEALNLGIVDHIITSPTTLYKNLK
jgi:ATP-dependent Clp protease protease subunit